MARKSGHVMRGGRLRRQSLWFGNQMSDTNVTAIGGTIIISANAALLALRPFTIVRTYSELNIRTDNPAGSENYAGAYGSCIVSDQASAIGVTAIPTPVSDSGSDLWYVHQFMMGANIFTTSGATMNGVGYHIDSKAMRKVDDDEDVLHVIEFSGIGSGMNIMFGGRQLIKLH